MRKIIAVLVLIVAIGGMMPLGMGYLAKRQMQNIAAHLSEQPQLTVTIDGYHRGYLSSTAVMSVVYKAVIHGADNQPKKVLPQVKFKLSEKISHGPILLTDQGLRVGMAYAQSELDQPAEISTADYNPSREQAREQENREAFRMTSMIHVNGASEHRFKLPKYSFEAYDSTFTASDLKGAWEMASDLKYHTGYLNLGSFIVEGLGYEARVNTPRLIFDVIHNELGLLTGQSKLQLPTFEVRQGSKVIYQLKNLEINSSTQVDADLYHLNFGSAFEDFNAAQQHYGPGLVKLSLENLDAVKVAELQQLIDQMQDPATESDQQQLQMMALLSKLPGVFNRGAKLTINPFVLTLPQGKIKLNGHVSLAPVADSVPVFSPLTLLPRLQGEVALRIPQTVAQQILVADARDKIVREQQYRAQRAQRQSAEGAQSEHIAPLSAIQLNEKAVRMADALITSLQENGYIQVDGDAYTSTAQVKAGQITINGKPLSTRLLGK
jgi:uncharacterized protein YdgA (DUF945 family)